MHALVPQRSEQSILEVSMAVNDAHHVFEMVDPVDGGFDGLYPLRLQSILFSPAFEFRGIAGQDLSLFHLGLDRVP